jgi:hypothetical protein
MRIIHFFPLLGLYIQLPRLLVFGPGHRGDFGAVGGEHVDVIFFDHPGKVWVWEKRVRG